MTDVRLLAFELADKHKIKHQFNKKKKIAGRNWMDGFLKRNPNLSFRKPKATSTARARSFNKPTVNSFFDLYQKILEANKFSPSRIYNADETAVSTVSMLKILV